MEVKDADIVNVNAEADASDDTGFDSSDDDIDPKAFAFYPNGRPSQSLSRATCLPIIIADSLLAKSTRFFLDAPLVPGQSEPYTLPTGIDVCPIEGCPAYHSGRVFKPPWRLNEHMKTRHGWPRPGKVKAPDVGSARGSRSLRTSRGRRVSLASSSSFPSTASKRKFKDDDHVNDSSPLSDPPIASSPTRPTRTRRQTAKGKEMAHSMAKLDSATSRRSSKKLYIDISSQSTPTDDDRSEDGSEDGSEDDNTGDSTNVSTDLAREEDHSIDGAMDIDSPIAIASPREPTIEDTRDHELIAAIRSLIAELRAASIQNPELVNAANEYQDLIMQDLVRVNCQVTEQNAKILSSCYKRLAERHNARAMVFSMHSSLPGVETQRRQINTPLPQDMPPAQHQKQPSPPKAFTFINDAPRPKGMKVNGFMPVNANGQVQQEHVPGPGANDSARPIMLKLKLTPGKEKDTNSTPRS